PRYPACACANGPMACRLPRGTSALAAPWLAKAPNCQCSPARSPMVTLPVVLGLMQWPAMAVTVIASWFVASGRSRRRKIGFWVFLLSNALWVAWGAHAHAYALIVLQMCLALMNIRGNKRNT